MSAATYLLLNVFLVVLLAVVLLHSTGSMRRAHYIFVGVFLLILGSVILCGVLKS
jgi:hypothetical protein